MHLKMDASIVLWVLHYVTNRPQLVKHCQNIIRVWSLEIAGNVYTLFSRTAFKSTIEVECTSSFWCTKSGLASSFNDLKCLHTRVPSRPRSKNRCQIRPRRLVCSWLVMCPETCDCQAVCSPGSWDGLWMNRVLWSTGNCACARYRTISLHLLSLFHRLSV